MGSARGFRARKLLPLDHRPPAAAFGSTDPQPDRAAAEDGRGAGRSQYTPVLMLTAVVSAISGTLCGYDTGIISGRCSSDEFQIGEGWQQVVAASIPLGAVIGALACSVLSERRGRRGTILLISVVLPRGRSPARWPRTPCCSRSGASCSTLR